MALLDGKVALITGGGTGIGRGVALALASEGAKVAVCGRRPEPLQRVVEEISQAGGLAYAVQADVSSEQDVERLVQETLQVFGPIDTLINNAGVDGHGRIHEHRVRDWDEVIAVNLRGPFLVSRAVLPGMRERRAGHIINIGSEFGVNHYAETGGYGVTKHALNTLGEIMQLENQDCGIRVNTICPEWVLTEMTAAAPGLDHSKCLYPEDIADLVVWLLTRRRGIRIGLPILVATMEDPWKQG